MALTDMSPAEVIARVEAARLNQMVLVVDAPGNRITRIVLNQTEAFQIVNAMPGLPSFAIAMPTHTVYVRS